MAVEKFSSRFMSFSRVLSQKADDVRRAAREGVASARCEKRRSTQIIEQACKAMENAQKAVKEATQQGGAKRYDGRTDKKG